ICRLGRGRIQRLRYTSQVAEVTAIRTRWRRYTLRICHPLTLQVAGLTAIRTRWHRYMLRICRLLTLQVAGLTAIRTRWRRYTLRICRPLTLQVAGPTTSRGRWRRYTLRTCRPCRTTASCRRPTRTPCIDASHRPANGLLIALCASGVSPPRAGGAGPRFYYRQQARGCQVVVSTGKSLARATARISIACSLPRGPSLIVCAAPVGRPAARATSAENTICRPDLCARARSCIAMPTTHPTAVSSVALPYPILPRTTLPA